MKRRFWVILMLLLNALGLYSQETHVVDANGKVPGNVKIGDIVVFEPLDQAHGRGIVFYINPERTGGWVIELSDKQTTYVWAKSIPGGPGATSVVDNLPTSSNIRDLLSDVDGKNNTRLIREFFGTYPISDYAAGCVDFEQGWYLPAAGQLRRFFGVLPLLEQTPAFTPPTYTANFYWSSTQFNRSNAWYVRNFYSNSDQNGSYFGNQSKSSKGFVRAVRDFEIAGSSFSYMWTQDGQELVGETDPDITVTPNATTEYCVTVTYGTVCSVGPVCQEIAVNSPEAVFEAPATACQNEPVTFTNQTTGTGASYSWDFGDRKLPEHGDVDDHGVAGSCSGVRSACYGVPERAGDVH